MHIYIIGINENTQSIIEICYLLNYKIAGFFDDNLNSNSNYNVLGNTDDICRYPKINIINAIDDAKIRYNTYLKLKHIDLNWINCIHPNCHISPDVELGNGNIICYGVVIKSGTRIGNFNFIDVYTIIGNNCDIGNYNTIKLRSTITDGTFINSHNVIYL